MKTVYIYANDRKLIAEYCHNTISPRRYYLHDAIGSNKWSVSSTDKGWQLTAPDEYVTLIALKYKVINTYETTAP